MKLQFKMIALAAILLLAGRAVQAQTETPTPPPADAPAKAHKDFKAKMESELNLSEEQKAHFQKVNTEYRTKEKEARQKMAVERKKRHEERTQALKTVLTPEQAAKFDALEKERKEAHKAKAGKRGKKRPE